MKSGGETIGRSAHRGPTVRIGSPYDNMDEQGLHLLYRGGMNPGGLEKGVDVSLALDLVRATYDRRYQVAIIVSQDWDFGPAVRMAKEIARAQGRRQSFESCIPVCLGSLSRTGVPGTT